MSTKGWYSSIKDYSQQESYLVPNAEIRGIGSPYVKQAGYFEASALLDPLQVAGSSFAAFAIPNPIIDRYLQASPGTASYPGVTWPTDTDTGRYLIAAGNPAESVDGDLKFDWNSTRLRLDSGFSLDITDMTTGSVLFAGSGGRVSQDNSNLNWDDTNNRLGIGCNDQFRTLEVRHASLSQLVLSSDFNNGILFTAGSIGLTIEHYNNLSQAPFYHFKGDENAEAVLKISNVDTGASASTLLHVSVEAGSGDARILWSTPFVTAWSAGLDNSASDAWKMSLGNVLGTNDVIAITTGGYTTFTPLVASSGTGHGFTVTGPINTAGANGLFRLTGGASTGQTASAEINFAYFDFAQTVTWAGGAIANERVFRISAPTLAFAGASTVTNAATVYIDRAPQAGTNATITNAYALWVDDGLTRFDGGITFSSFTQGSVLFAGSGGALSQDNTNLFWDDTSDFLRLTSTAGKQLHLRYDSSNHVAYAVSSSGGITATVTGTTPSSVFTAAHAGEFAFTIENTSSNGAAAAVGILSTPSTGADSYFSIRISGGSRWAVGVDNSDSDAFKIVPGSTPSDTAAVKIDTSRNIFFPDFTQGSVLFIGASGEVIENNASLFWDNSDISLTINKNDTTTTPMVDLIQSSTGDAVSRWALDASDSYAAGIDNSDSNKWKLSYGSAGDAVLGTNDRLTLSTAGLFTVVQYMNVGTATDSAAQGDLAVGLTGAARLFYDQSVPILYSYNSSGTIVNQISAVASTATVWNEQGADIDFRIEGDTLSNLFFVDASADKIGINTSGPDRTLEVLDASNPQLRLTHTDGSVYTDFQVNSSGQLTIAPTGNKIFITSTMESQGLTIPFQSIDQTTGAVACRFKNTTGDFYFGIENSTATFFAATVAYDAVFFTTSPFRVVHSNTSKLYAATAGVSIGVASLATTATNGFVYVPACAGTPTGTPTGMTGYAPIVVDTSNNKLYFYSGGSWRDAGP